MKLLCAILLSVASVASAATYYVDFATGNDANNGTSTSTPFKHCPGDTNATATADSTALSAGDTVKFKGGVTYLGGVLFDWSGTAGSPITYDGNHAGDWGTGRAVVDYEYGLGSCFASSAAGRVNITVQGFELRNAGGWADDDPAVTNAAAGTVTNSTARWGGGVTFNSGNHTNIVLDNLYIHRMGGWRNTQGWTAATVDGAGIYFLNSKSVVITNCEMTKMKVGVALYSSAVARDITVRDCDIHDYIVWGVDVATTANNAVFDAITIRDNTIRDYAQFNLGNWSGVGETPHTDGIFLRTAAYDATGWTNVLIFNNEFYCDNPGSGQGGTASIFISQGASGTIFNNLFNSDNQSRAIGVEHFTEVDTDQQVRIFNNTFISGSPAIILATEETFRYTDIRNNIFRMPSGMAANNTIITRLTGKAPDALDYNLYYDPDWTGATKRTHLWPSSNYIFFNNLFTSTGFEEHGQYADPLFVDFAATPSDRDLRLQANSPAIGAGTNLSAYFTTDKNGVARGSTWDIGAFEYQAPRTIRATTFNAGTVIFGP